MVAQINRVAFELFGLQIYWYAIIIVSGIALALWMSNREAVRIGLKEFYFMGTADRDYRCSLVLHLV